MSIILLSALIIPGTVPITGLARTTSQDAPDVIDNPAYQYPSFTNGEVVDNAKKGRLPAMGWNSWNAFGSGNTEALTRAMVEK